MTIRRKSLFLSTLVLGSTVVSRAIAAIVGPVGPTEEVTENIWAAARRDFEVPAVEGDFSTVAAWVRNQIGSRPVSAVIPESYDLPGVDPAQLDRLWMRILTRRDDAAAIETFVRMRASIENRLPNSREEFLREWLVQTTAGGCYGNCGIGLGNGGGNGTGNEGNGVGPKSNPHN